VALVAELPDLSSVVPTQHTGALAAPNHAYIVDVALASVAAGGAVLDFGCGAGTVVEAARGAGLRGYGADVFNRRNASLHRIARQGLGGWICRIGDRRLPFRDAAFDAVLSNQVFEHVFELDAVLAEIRRVLRPGGRLIAIFPSDEVWREGHCGVPFVHWFDRRSRLRLPYMLAARGIGLGAKKDDRSFQRWALDHLEYIDDYTVYRTPGEIEAALSRHFEPVVHIETAYCRYRLRRRNWNTAARLAGTPGLADVAAWLCRKLASMVVVCTKPSD
jgi:SAM-dependent methyltransferase